MRRRTCVKIVACLLAGFAINFGIAAALGSRPDAGANSRGWGFGANSGTCTVEWRGDTGRTSICMTWLGRASGGSESPNNLSLIATGFESVFANPVNLPTNNWPPGTTYDTWRSRLFPSWAQWVFTVDQPRESRVAIATGWPLRSFIGWEERTATARGPRTIQGFFFRSGPLRAISCVPIPWGTVVNSILFALPVMLVAWALPRLRARRRRARGQCPLCRYDLSGDLAGGCPECGWNRPSSSATPADALAPHPNLA